MFKGSFIGSNSKWFLPSTKLRCGTLCPLNWQKTPKGIVYIIYIYLSVFVLHSSGHTTHGREWEIETAGKQNISSHFLHTVMMNIMINLCKSLVFFSSSSIWSEGYGDIQWSQTNGSSISKFREHYVWRRPIIRICNKCILFCWPSPR